MPLLVGLERELHQVLCSSEKDGRDLLGKHLQTPRQLASVSESVAHKLLCLFATRKVLVEDDSGRGRESMVQADKREHRINHRVQGAHALISFQCKDCWMINLEDRQRLPGSDYAFVMLIRQANLDAMGGRAQATIEAHAAFIRRLTKNCKLF